MTGTLCVEAQTNRVGEGGRLPLGNRVREEDSTGLAVSSGCVPVEQSGMPIQYFSTLRKEDDDIGFSLRERAILGDGVSLPIPVYILSSGERVI